MHPIYNAYIYHDSESNGKLGSDTQQGYGYTYRDDVSTTLGPASADGSSNSILEHDLDGSSFLPNHYNYLSHLFTDSSLPTSEQCMSMMASPDFGDQKSTNACVASQFDYIPLWETYLEVNAVAAQHLGCSPGHANQAASLHMAPSSSAPTNVQIGLDPPHGLFDLRSISKEPPNVSQLALQDPHGPGYHCTLAQCTSPFKTFASIADVIEHIRTEDAVMSRPQGVWCSCNKWFSSKQVGQRHVRSLNGGKQYPCPYCSMRFKRLDEVTAHARARHLSSPRKIVGTTKKRIAKRKPSSHDV